MNPGNAPPRIKIPGRNIAHVRNYLKRNLYYSKKEVLNFSCTDPSRAQSQYQQYYSNTELKN